MTGLPPTPELEQAAVRLLLSDGLSGLTFGRLSRATGVSDRMLVYRFGTKTALLGRTLDLVAVELRDQLAPLAGPASPARLLERAAQALSAPENGPVLAVWFEVLAGAARDDPVCAAAARHVAAGWHGWLTQALTDEPDPWLAASHLLARLEGVLVLHATGLRDEAVAAARA